MLRKVFGLLLFCHYFVDNGTAEQEKYIRTVHGYDPPVGSQRTYVFDADSAPLGGSPGAGGRQRRSVAPTSNDTIIQKMKSLNDTHKQLMVHWVGEGSNVIICLARDPYPSSVSSLIPVNPSAVYISYDYGDTYENKTEQFKLPDGSYALLEKFYNHPKYNTHFVFADVRHKKLFVTPNHGRTIQMYPVRFTPSEVSFHEFQPSVFIVHDKEDKMQKLYVTEDFGNSFRMVQDYVKAFYWVKTNENDDSHRLVVQRKEPNSLSVIIHSFNYFSSRIAVIYATNVKDFYVKGDYLFTTRVNSKGMLELFVSYKLGKQVKCIFDTQLDQKSFFVVDVTNNRALVAVSHADTVSHLYVSENVEGKSTVLFTLSLEDVLCYFPNSTWHDTWLHHVSEDAFADVYKVEGMTGIYIASQVKDKPEAMMLGPNHLQSLITFDHGRSWRFIRAPLMDIEGQRTECNGKSQNCTLHLSQKFSQLYPDTRSIGILSSKSAPGVIVATGVTGYSLKGHYGVYISTDAGMTWRQSLRDLYFFNMGDHGGILTAVKYFKSRGETRHILYSTDEGETWKQTEFHSEDIRLYGLMTEPGENTTVFTMFGSLPHEHQWIIIKLDMIKVFAYNCTKDDYKPWSPSQSDENRNYIPCVMGQEITYTRRVRHSNCYNGLDFDAPTSVLPCDCDVVDYECDFGFVRSNKPGHCVRNKTLLIDPYKIPEDCKPGQFYNRTKGYRKVQGDVCRDGFQHQYLPDVIPCPIDEAQDFLLFAQRERISRFNLVTKSMEELPVKKLRNVIAIDFDMRNNCVYWADIALDVIGRQCFNNESEAEILVSSDLASIEGMALDWISNTLYFVDGMRAKIELIRTDINHSGRMRRTVLGSDVLRKPRGIALHPKSGYMFWTDWSAENPSVNRANLDGTNIMKLFEKPKVEWPNGITIDYIAERIYWVDARQDYIASSDLHGDFFKIIIANDEVVSHPFAVAVFKSSMYWDDWKRNAIFSADKDTFKGVEVLLNQLPGLMDLKVYAHGIQVGTNGCTNTTCSHICLGAPKGKNVCLCPDGMEQKNGKCLCPGGVEAFANATCPKIGNTCSSEHFSCANGFCVPKGWRCDGEDDCGDSSDEQKCGTQTCPATYFVCGDGKCIPQYWKCDYDPDCSDGSDELDCPKHNCTEGQFTCANGRCIAAKWKCDGENDCRDGSDEQNCAPPEPSTCKNEEFHCKTGGVTCIPPTWRCDGEKDCRDGSDEMDCTNNTCLDIQFPCGPPHNKCIYSTWVCDGDKDCPNGEDERNCSSTLPDLIDHSDPFMPKNGTCQEWMFKCVNEKCVPYWWKCDGSDDCGDNSDEQGCSAVDTTTTPAPTRKPLPPPLVPNVCGNNQYQCPIGGACILSSWVCDGMQDCVGGDDEANCDSAVKCASDQFMCVMDGSCVPLKAVCDQTFDCPDKTDELWCDHNLPNGPAATPSCSLGYFPCDGNTCYPLAVLCDGKVDCKDGYDESNCSTISRVYQVLQMGVDERGINESALSLYWWMPTPTDAKLEFLPSISKVGEDAWTNQTWTNSTEYKFGNLQAYTKYNMTIYVRIQGSTKVFPPAKYFVAYTGEGVPTEPWNVTAQQKDGTHVLISWQKPVRSNGQIVDYQICWYPPLPPVKLKIGKNDTSFKFAAEFQPNVTYSFYIIAHNRKYESKSSEVATLTFDGNFHMDYVQALKVANITNSSVSLTWTYASAVDGFTVAISTDSPYHPRVANRTTNSTEIVVDKLSPGEHYYFKVRPYRKNVIGPVSTVNAVTKGTTLPEVPSVQAIVVKELGTTVKLSWEVPKDARKVVWVYGVYYGIDEEQLFEKARLETTNQTATVSHLEACEMYRFRVGVVGPLGLGPISKVYADITTSMNRKAPPKKLTVEPVNEQANRIKVSWAPSCPQSVETPSYMIRVYESVKDHVWYVKSVNTKELSQVLNVTYGATYNISVATDDPDAIYTANVTYNAPPILPPHEVKTFIENNGSFVLYWQDRAGLQVDSYQYEVLVSEGDTLDEATALRFLVTEPPFIYSNATAKMYTFALRIKTKNGYRSLMSERISALSAASAPSSSGAATPNAAAASQGSMSGTIIGLILTASGIGLILLALLVIFVMKHRRLQNSFSRFANSHYDTRSGAATFDDTALEEEDTPQITGFSDDEPLVIA